MLPIPSKSLTSLISDLFPASRFSLSQAKRELSGKFCGAEGRGGLKSIRVSNRIMGRSPLQQPAGNPFLTLSPRAFLRQPRGK